MLYRSGDSYYAMFCTQRFDTGAAADASSTPVVTVSRNGTDDSSFVLAVARIATGRYTISGSVPASYLPGDVIQVSVAATVAGASGQAVVDQFRVVAVNLSDAAAAGLTDVAAIKAKTDNLPADPASNTQVNTRLAASAYTAPDNTDVAAIKAKTDNLPADPASNTQVNTRLAASAYTAPDNTDVAAIKAKTDNLPDNPAATGDPMTLTVNERNAVADAILQRDVSGVEATAPEHSLCFVVLAMSESNTTAHANRLTVFRSDGSTEFVQKTITTNSAADPITGVS
jgi:chorismate mutase